MTTAVCTLFEGDYHYGVGALCNSLYQNGYRGVVYAGYRGPLPPWVEATKQVNGYSEFAVDPHFIFRFIPLATEIHFTNYKPEFMLSLWRDHCPDADAVFYFDPDITVICRWSFFEEWVEGGVAVCADGNDDMPASHPYRRAWMRYFEPHGIHLVREQNTYFNGGFVGVARKNIAFLSHWQRLLQLLGPTVGELRYYRVPVNQYWFQLPDQETMNVATMTCTEPLSCVGRQGMDFEGGGGYVMSHAVAPEKPWRKHMLWSTLRTGQRPNRADKYFFRCVRSPIRLYSPARLALKKLDLLAGSAVGRYIG